MLCNNFSYITQCSLNTKITRSTCTCISEASNQQYPICRKETSKRRVEMYADPDDLIPAAQQLPPHKEGEHVNVPVQDTGQVSWAYVGVARVLWLAMLFMQVLRILYAVSSFSGVLS